MRLSIPHTFSRAEAVARVRRALEEARPHFKDTAQVHEERWEGDTLHFDVSAEGQRVRGTLSVEDAQYVVDAKLPLVLRLFETRIEKAIAEEVRKRM